MKKFVSFGILIFLIQGIPFARGQTALRPTLPTPGPETIQLATIFTGNWDWEGTLQPGALGPNSPALPSKGTIVNTSVADGFWFTSNMECSYGGVPAILTWKGHLVVGWNSGNRTYQGILVDNLGILVQFQGEIHGSTLVLTAEKPNVMNGSKILARFTYDFTDPSAIRFLNEHQINAGAWQVFEQAILSHGVY